MIRSAENGKAFAGIGGVPYGTAAKVSPNGTARMLNIRCRLPLAVMRGRMPVLSACRSLDLAALMRATSGGGN